MLGGSREPQDAVPADTASAQPGTDVCHMSWADRTSAAASFKLLVQEPSPPCNLHRRSLSHPFIADIVQFQTNGYLVVLPLCLLPCRHHATVSEAPHGQHWLIHQRHCRLQQRQEGQCSCTILPRSLPSTLLQLPSSSSCFSCSEALLALLPPSHSNPPIQCCRLAGIRLLLQEQGPASLCYCLSANSEPQCCCPAGITLLFQKRERRRTLALYTLARLAQCYYNSQKQQGRWHAWGSDWQYGDALLFAVSSAQVSCPVCTHDAHAQACEGC